MCRRGVNPNKSCPGGANMTLSRIVEPMKNIVYNLICMLSNRLFSLSFFKKLLVYTLLEANEEKRLPEVLQLQTLK